MNFKPTGYNAPAYLIKSTDDPVFKHLSDYEIAKMVRGIMPLRKIDGWSRPVAIHVSDEELESLRYRYPVN